MRETARLTSSLLGYRLTDAKRRYCRRGVSSGPTLMWGIWTKKEPLLLPCCPLPVLLPPAPVQPRLPGTHPCPAPRSAYLLLPTDMAHGGGRCRAGGGPQDRHDSLGKDLTHCKGWGETDGDQGPSSPSSPGPEAPLMLGAARSPLATPDPEAQSLTPPTALNK